MNEIEYVSYEQPKKKKKTFNSILTQTILALTMNTQVIM